MKYLNILAAIAVSLTFASCTKFLDDQIPQGTMSDAQLMDPQYVENMVISAYAI